MPPLRDHYSLTFSPSLPQGLNLGRQLFYLQTLPRGPVSSAPRTCCCIRSTGRGDLSGTMAAEVTSLGTHTDLWRPHEHAYSSLARKQGWARMMPPHTFGAMTDSGRIRHSVVAATGLDHACEVACGIHDSNASYLRFLMDREREAFTVVSSGTWTIVMANRGDLRRLREERDMLANVNAFGAPVATARYMGGREYEAIAQSGDEAHGRCGDRGARRCGAMALPSFASAGPYSGQARAPRRRRVTAAARSAPRCATLYSALMTAVLIESLGAAGEIFVDGPLARNPLFARLLAACVPVGTVRTYPEGGGTRVAAHLARHAIAGAGRPAVGGAAAAAGAARIPGRTGAIGSRKNQGIRGPSASSTM